MADPRDRAWRAYVEKELAKKGKTEEDPADTEEQLQIDILETNHDIEIDEAPAAVKRVLNRMHEPQLRKSVTYQGPTLYKTGDKAGTVRYAAKELENYGAKSISDRYILTANWSGGKFSFARFYDRESREIRFTKLVGDLEGWLKDE
jgi:hypothetical protein